MRKNDAKWRKGRKRKYPTEGKHSQWFNTGRYSAGKASEFRRKPGFKSILRSAGRSRFIIYLDLSVPLTQAAFPVSFHIPGPSQAETGRVVQRLCKRCQRDAAKALLLLRCHHGLAGTCCWGKRCHPHEFSLDKVLPEPPGDTCVLAVVIRGSGMCWLPPRSFYCHFCLLRLCSFTASAKLHGKVKGIKMSNVSEEHCKGMSPWCLHSPAGIPHHCFNFYTLILGLRGLNSLEIPKRDKTESAFSLVLKLKPS